MNAILKNKGLRLAVVVAGIVGAIAVVVLVRQYRHRYDERITSSCANHGVQLRFLVMEFIEQEERFPLERDTRSALTKMSLKGERSSAWLSSYGSACPESYFRDSSIGYVFVADGLPTRVVVENSALVLFCPADSHQRSEQHCHAVIGDGELLCIKSNIEMIKLLRREITRAEDGVVPYSTNALLKMEREVKVREERERQREKTAGQNLHSSVHSRLMSDRCDELYSCRGRPIGASFLR